MHREEITVARLITWLDRRVLKAVAANQPQTAQQTAAVSQAINGLLDEMVKEQYAIRKD